MKRRMFYKKDYVKELLRIIRTETDTTKLPKLLSDYHEKDIAEAITLLSETERRQLYPVLGAQKVAEIFSYLDDSEKYIEELPIEKAAIWTKMHRRMSANCSPMMKMKSAAA